MLDDHKPFLLVLSRPILTVGNHVCYYASVCLLRPTTSQPH